MKEVFSLFFVLATTIAVAQGIKFEKTTHDFGEVEEAGGPVSYSFSFVNDQEDSIKIVGVRASCGCTTPKWTGEYVQKGESGEVMAQYNPYNRPGPFNKSLRITTSSGGSQMLFIKGKVKPRPRTIKDDLPVKLGNLRVKYKSLNMGRLKTNAPITKAFDLYNEGDSVISFNTNGSVPEYISIKAEPEQIAPKAKGKLLVTYDPTQYSELGFTNTPVVMSTSDHAMPEKRFSVLATIEEYFPPMSEEEMARAPKLTFEKRQYDFGIINNTVPQTEIVLNNGGKSSLNIRSIKPNCNCIKVEMPSYDIEAGKSVGMKISFDPQGRRGRQYKTITIFSNDPMAPTQVISIKADVRNSK